MIRDIEADLIDQVLFIKLDRFFRNVGAYYEVMPIFEKHGVTWKAILEDYETETASGRFKVNIMLSVAQDEADRTSERIRFVNESKVKKGEVVTGHVPLGYRIENKHLVIDEQTAPMVRDIFQHYIDLRSCRGLSRWLFEEYNYSLCNHTLAKLLTNEKYIGRYTDNNEYCPALIDMATWNTVQQIKTVRAERNAGVTNTFLFTGLLRCPQCGNRLVANKHKDKHYVYYRCSLFRATSGTRCSNSAGYREDLIESWLLDNIVSELNVHNKQISVTSRKAKTVDVSAVKRKMEKLKDLYLNDLIDRDVYERDYRELEAKLNEAVEPPKIVDTSILTEPLKVYSSLPKDKQKAFWSRIIREIHPQEDGYEIIWN